MRKLVVCMLLTAFTAACARDVTAPAFVAANPVRGVTITIDAHGRCLVTCDPPFANATMTLVTIRNTGTSTSYMQACGSTEYVFEQQLVDGKWQNVGPAITCAVGPQSIALAPGDTAQMNWFFASGRRRLALGIGGVADMSDAALDTSAEIDLP
ncbi:MAG TPA: hypothetical protein VGQ30_15655 [Gemmatimonadaceae bacterium]|jgi:hypothetical protein|nr:hypothetical protein [Gemmatimonadaceae bacterium]